MKRRRFIHSVGISGIAFSGLLPAISCVSNRKDPEEELKQQALLAFKRFEEVWDFSDFWKRGNTFDACLVFANAMQKRWPDDPQVSEMNEKIVKMLELNLAFFASVNFGVMWADDFGWWGLMALNARKFLLKFDEIALADKYWTLADDLCWQHKKNAAYDHTTDALPVPHGCRNGDANGQSLGVKNTVTNVLLFLLSTRIYRLAKAEKRKDTDKYLDMAYRQWVWFTEWFKLEEYEFLKRLTTEGALVQERPMAEFEGSGYTDKIHPPWAEGWVWTGDQGMLVAALSDMISEKEDYAKFVEKHNLDPEFTVSGFEAKAHKIIRSIGKGVKNALISTSDGLIREAACLSSLGPVHGGDYLAGRGIMMRYLGSDQEKSLIGVNLDNAVRKTIKAIWETRNPGNNQFQPEYTTTENDKLYIEQFRKLWGLADDVQKWDLKPMPAEHKNGVCQAVGLDMLGAAINSL
ncbi:MAG: hypothetical protein MI975_09700 [Cytophagales bacterium]|nr:hypothetical protein [Cytophagales bacterium]